MTTLRACSLRRVSFIAVLLAGSVAPSPASAKEIDGAELSMIGLGPSLTRARGGDRSGALGAFGLATNRVGFGLEKLVAVRVVNSGSIALGSRGLQGGTGSALAGGLRIPVARTHGVVVRGGLEGSFFGNRWLWDSLLEVPQLHLGYQWLRPYDDRVVGDKVPPQASDTQMFDVAAKSGYVLLGRHNTGDAASRNTGGALETGGIGSLHLGPVTVHASYTRIFAGRGGDPVDQLEASLCGRAGPLVVCETVRREVGDVHVPSSGSYRSSEVSVIGLTVALVKEKNGRLD